MSHILLVIVMNSNIPRGLRNDNPLNIRYYAHNDWLGSIPDESKRDMLFEEFKASRYGFRAAFKLLHRYIRQGYNTVESIISRWAPASENNTKVYIESVCKYLNWQPTRQIYIYDRQDFMALVEAMFNVEIGMPMCSARHLLGINYYEEMAIGYDLYNTHFIN